MLLLADENFNAAIVRGLLRRIPGLDVVTVQDVGLSGADDDVLLEWVAEHGRILLTHDVTTIPEFVRSRLEAGKRVPRVVEVPSLLPISDAIGDRILLIECSEENEWEGQIVHIPL